MNNYFFVSYKTALKLKEKGFNEPCFAYHRELLGSKEPIFHINENKYKPVINSELGENKYNMVSAPNLTQVRDWFIKNHNISINIEYGYEEDIYLKARFKNKKNQNDCISKYYIISDNKHCYLTHNTLIQECLKLI